MKHADIAWLVLAVLILVYEVAAPPGELLSEGWDRYLVRFPVSSRIVPVVLTLHVLNLLPKQFDPLYRIARVVGGFYDRGERNRLGC